MEKTNKNKIDEIIEVMMLENVELLRFMKDNLLAPTNYKNIDAD